MASKYIWKRTNKIVINLLIFKIYLMHKSIFKIVCLIGFFAYYKSTYSQTTTFNYLNSSLSTSACNVFNPAVNVNSISHSSHAGGVSFNATNGLILSTTPKSSPQGGTAFVINYTFVPGNYYNISILSRRVSSIRQANSSQ